MRVYIGADHRGFKLKERLGLWLAGKGHEVVDVGARVWDEEDDYPDVAIEVVRGVMENEGSRGVLLCGSGHGMDIAANRFRQIRSILGFNLEVVRQGREHEDANVLSLPADWIDEILARRMVEVFLETEFSGLERHRRRIEKLGEWGEGEL